MKRKEKVILGALLILVVIQLVLHGLAMKAIMAGIFGYSIYQCIRKRR